MKDIKKLENKIAPSTDFFNSISAGIIILDFDNNLRLLALNDSGYQMLGYTKEQFATELNNEAMNIVYEEDRAATAQFMLSIRANNYLESYQHRIVRRDGKILWMQGTASAYMDAAGNKSAIITFLDITERKELEKKLSEKIAALEYSEKRYELAVIHADVVVFDYIIETKQIFYSDIAVEKYNYPPVISDAVEKIIADGKVHPISVDKMRDAYQRIVDGEAVVECTLVLIDSNGKERVNDLSLTNIFDKMGNPVRAIGILRDITQKMLFASETQYKETMLVGSLFNYEINVTKDLIISGMGFWKNALNLHTNSFSQIIALVKEKIVHIDDREKFGEFIARNNLVKLFNQGIINTKLEYRQMTEGNKFIWVSNNIHLIRDISTQDIKGLCYINDINDKKQQELNISEQKHYYDLFIRKSARVYNINVTKDIITQTNEAATKYGNDSYDKKAKFFIKNILHQEEVAAFKEKFLRKNMIRAYKSGVKELYSEHRHVNKEGKITWFSFSLHFSEDIQTKDILATCYVQNINNTKVRETELIYKSEHDSLTDVYNKITTEKMVEAYLLSADGRKGKHAFFIFDIDYFKPINDNFGHVFGDMILSQVAKKAQSLFRAEDIIGRIGGDEFVVFMRNISGAELVKLKADEICKALREQYKQRGEIFNLSSSIGISLYPEHGLSYKDLYMHADTALYVSKDNGKNKFTFYDESMNCTQTSIKTIDQKELLEDKVFDENVTEYVFRILYESNDKEAAINSILELVGRHFKASRSYIFENSLDNKTINNTFEWCDLGVSAQISELQNIRHEDLDNYWENFDADGIFYMPDTISADARIKAYLEPQSIKSMIQFSIIKHGKLVGFVGFDQNDFCRVCAKSEISEMKFIANLLGVFILELRASQRNEAIKDTALSIVNALNSYSYVIDRNSYKLLFINEKAKYVVKTAQIGDTCYEAFWNMKSSCEVCPMKYLSKDGKVGKQKYSLEIYNDNLDLWVKTTASWIDWTDGGKACLIESLDINDYKKKPPKSKRKKRSAL